MAYNPYSLENKTILVTGASSGIGKATAIECAKLGASLVITARNEERLKAVYNELDRSFDQVHQMVIADLSKNRLSGVFCLETTRLRSFLKEPKNLASGTSIRK